MRSPNESIGTYHKIYTSSNTGHNILVSIIIGMWMLYILAILDIVLQVAGIETSNI